MHSAIFDSIEDFTKVKQNCIFCKNPLRIILTNFNGLAKTGIPLLNAPIKDEEIVFNVSNTTSSYSVEATAKVDIKTNALNFDVASFSHFPSPYKNIADYLFNPLEILDGESKACEAFINLKPYIQHYCPNKSCNMEYSINSEVLTVKRLPLKNEVSVWKINYFRLWMETFVIDNLWVQNDWMRNSTNIYSLNKPDVDPITTPMIDFENMNSAKLINRIRLLTTFS